jgi:hypothetical protein
MKPRHHAHTKGALKPLQHPEPDQTAAIKLGNKRSACCHTALIDVSNCFTIARIDYLCSACDSDAVLAGCLGFVHRLIGARQKCFD